MNSYSHRPQQHSNRHIKLFQRLGVPFFWGFTLSLMYSSLCVTIPHVVHETTGFYLSGAVWFIFVQSVLNWFLISRDVKTGKPVDARSVKSHDGSAAADWRHCDACAAPAPPRSHHCAICNTCIPRRDHHCYFTGSCIGHTNQRRFIVLLAYLACGSVLGVTLDFLHLNSALPFSTDFIYYLPMSFLYRYLFTGDLTMGLLLIMLQGYFCTLTLVSAIAYLVIEVKLTVKGQTQYESGKNINTYRGSLVQNIRMVFGSLWLVPFHFVVPIAMPLPNDWEDPKTE